MWLKTATIRNFRSIENLTINFDRRANVIVGPNAVGKTTLLEAIRLTKAALAPRTMNEAQQVFVGLGAISPHSPQNLNYRALGRDVTRSVEIDTEFELTDSDIAALENLVPNLATAVVRAKLGPQALTQGPLALVQYLSSSEGMQQLTEERKAIETGLIIIRSNKRINLKLRIDPTTGTINGENQLDQMILASMEGALPAHQALFSYFPADRAMPAGEVAIQIGGADAAAQLETHNSQPQTKYHRLKPTIVNNFLLSEETREKLKSNFEKIFSRLLKGRTLLGINVSPIGLVSIEISEDVGKRPFDIDGMSSGEKGIILTFLLISHSVASGGMIMIDEPELHLNPAVCKLLLPFLIDEYLVPNDIQAIICSHSPEVLGSAFDSSQCALLHLQSPTVLSKIYPEDKREVFDALRRLGTSASEVLFSAGSIFVEGEHDAELLQVGFDKLVVKYQVTELGGRGNIEKEIETLQRAEKNEEIDTLKCFIFDLDKAPTALKSSRLVKVLQWKRRCLENYLLDEKIIYDLLSDGELSKHTISMRGEVRNILHDLALNQLQEEVAESVYNAIHFENPGMRPKEIAGQSYSTMADRLFKRLETMQSQLRGLDEDSWKTSFTSKCNDEHKIRLAEWESDWIRLCDGKRLFRDLQTEFKIAVSPIKFKKLIIERMQREQSDDWVVIEKLLIDALAVV